MWEVSPHLHLLWAYSGGVGGTGQIGGAGSPHPVPQGSVPESLKQPTKTEVKRVFTQTWGWGPGRPYLMAGPRVACHMLDHDGEQVLTEHLRRKWWAVRTGPTYRGPRGRPCPILTGCREKRLRNMGTVRGLLRLVRKELSADE